MHTCRLSADVIPRLYLYPWLSRFHLGRCHPLLKGDMRQCSPGRLSLSQTSGLFQNPDSICPRFVFCRVDTKRFCALSHFQCKHRPAGTSMSNSRGKNQEELFMKQFKIPEKSKIQTFSHPEHPDTAPKWWRYQHATFPNHCILLE